jgi:hypothetical protein
MKEKSQVTKRKLHSEQRKNHKRNHKIFGRTAKKHGEIGKRQKLKIVPSSLPGSPDRVKDSMIR